jgi:hypothetical protein
MWCSSQNTYPKLVSDSLIAITPQQLKATNLIFLEHKRYKLEIPELNKQITSYRGLVNSYMESDSVKSEQILWLNSYITEVNKTVELKSREIDKLSSRNRLYKGLTICGFTVSVVLVIALLCN